MRSLSYHIFSFKRNVVFNISKVLVWHLLDVHIPVNLYNFCRNVDGFYVLLGVYSVQENL